MATSAATGAVVVVLVVGAVVLAVLLGSTLDEEQSVVVVLAFLGEDGNGEFGGAEADISGLEVTPIVLVLSLVTPPAHAPCPPAAEAEVLEILEANIVMRCILCTITIACISV